MNPFGSNVKAFLIQRGYAYKGSFWKYLPAKSLLAELSFRPVTLAFGEPKSLGHACALRVYYPAQDHFVLVSPAELTDLRRDGTLRHVVFTSEHDGIFAKIESDVVEHLLDNWFDFWMEKLTDPSCALAIVGALRARAPFPPYLAYLANFVATSQESQLGFEIRKQAAVTLFDGGTNFYSYVAYLNAARRFDEAHELIQQAQHKDFFEGRAHASVVASDSFLRKLADDALRQEIVLGQANLRELARRGCHPGEAPH